MPIELARARAGVIVLLVICVLASVVVFSLYFRAWLASRRVGNRRAGLAPVHVALVSLSTIDLQTALAWGLAEGLSGTPPMFGPTLARTVMYGMGSIGILLSLFVIGSQQTRRQVRFKRRSRVLVDRNEQVEIDPR